MLRYRVKIALLALGVVLGYGQAIAHFSRGHGHGGTCLHDWDRQTWDDKHR